MHFASTALPGVFLVTPERIADERGFFAQTWAPAEFAASGLNACVAARSVSYNRAAGTLRGMHFQHAPHAEAKLVSAISGAMFDVAVDLRRASPSFGTWVGAELRPDDGTMLYIPEGCAHGFVTLEPHTTVEYLISAGYAPEASDGVRWDDPFFAIRWPRQPTVISARDRARPDYEIGMFAGL